MRDLWSNEAVLPPFAWPNYVLGNHDQIHWQHALRSAQARLAAMMLPACGTPTV
jgi:alpha-glucosidase